MTRALAPKPSTWTHIYGIFLQTLPRLLYPPLRRLALPLHRVLLGRIPCALVLLLLLLLHRREIPNRAASKVRKKMKTDYGKTSLFDRVNLWGGSSNVRLSGAWNGQTASIWFILHSGCLQPDVRCAPLAVTATGYHALCIP